jgi:hypothetical protein
LYYYGYRYYLPWQGRWLNADPAGIADGLNLFRMTKNNPITFYDNNGAMPYTFYNKENDEEIEIPNFSLDEKSKSLEIAQQYASIVKIISSKVNSIVSSKEKIVTQESFEPLSWIGLGNITRYTQFPEEFYGEENEEGEILSKTLVKLRPEEGHVVFRGSLALKEAYGGKIKIGDIASNNDRFLSTSQEAFVAADFLSKCIIGPRKRTAEGLLIKLIRSQKATEPIFFIINTLSGRDIDELSTSRVQAEILIPQERNFLVTGIIQDELFYKTFSLGPSFPAKYVFLSEVEGPFLFQENEQTAVRSLAKNIYTGD